MTAFYWAALIMVVCGAIITARLKYLERKYEKEFEEESKQ